MNNESRETLPRRTRLIPVTKWGQHHPWPPIGGLRHLIFHAESNGFHTVIRRVGRSVLIDEMCFFEWVESLAKGRRRHSEKWTQTDFFNKS